MGKLKRFAVSSVGCAAAAGIVFGVAAPAQADTLHVVEKTRYWSDNSSYYEYGPFRGPEHCANFARSNPALAPLFTSKQATCFAPSLASNAPWFLNAPINVL
ncbi:MAG: hypothetical protein C0482_29355 [Gordonia sp.]|uniref:hypothetical protein n=1 Tax=Williamsia sp. 1138 TaxID=1903117 RepID=UPI000A11F20B|nr:hypothetical protein [Williamsia sp. 1138]MBA4026467.1 hypothetical protein [Gordonia sp. (in: high G+C Gram-positive bacteria)]OZG29707.1 hypothetical protein BH683_007150 [Williamsia sp. 1138]